MLELTEFPDPHGGTMRVRKIAAHQYFGIDRKGEIHLIEYDPSSAVEMACQHLRKESRGNVRNVCSPDLTWQLESRIPTVIYAAFGEQFKDPEFKGHFLRKNPQYAVHQEGTGRTPKVIVPDNWGKKGVEDE